jgi:flagellar FliL protein
MASNSLEASRGGARSEEMKPSDNGKAPEAKAEAPAGGGGIKPWLPLVICVVTMPALAYATTQFVLLPKLQHAIGGAAAATAPAESSGGGEAKGGEAKGGEKPVLGKGKVTVPLTKLLVNVAGTMGTRYLMTSLTLVGNGSDFKDKIEDNKDQLQDLATGTLSSKTISDLEKPGARNVIRSELLTVFNNALGGPVVQEIYITELAIQ